MRRELIYENGVALSVAVYRIVPSWLDLIVAILFQQLLTLRAPEPLNKVFYEILNLFLYKLRHRDRRLLVQREHLLLEAYRLEPSALGVMPCSIVQLLLMLSVLQALLFARYLIMV